MYYFLITAELAMNPVLLQVLPGRRWDAERSEMAQIARHGTTWGWWEGQGWWLLDITLPQAQMQDKIRRSCGLAQRLAQASVSAWAGKPSRIRRFRAPDISP